MSYQWFRMWSDAVDDEKLRLLAFEDRWHFVALLCLKRSGLLDEPESDLKRQKLCIKMGLDSVELETAMKRLVTIGLITDTFQPIAWNKRQFESDSSTSRVRAFRKRQRNGNETFQKRPQTTDSDTDTEKKAADAAIVLHENLPKETWEEWLAHRREKRLTMSPRALNKQLKLLARYDTATQRDMIDTSINAGWEGIFAPKGGKPQEETRRGLPTLRV